MKKFAQRMMAGRSPGTGQQAASSIFGSAATLSQNIQSRPDLRIAMYPCISKNAPETAMGLWSLLAYFLEGNLDAAIYRISAKVSGTPEEYIWSIEQSQFEIEDWELEGLDDNIALWGTLEQSEDRWIFKVFGEQDSEESDDSWTYSASSLARLISSLPELVSKIAAFLETSPKSETLQDVLDDIEETVAIETLIQLMFHWDLKLYLMLWGKDWSDEDIIQDHQKLFSEAKKIGSIFSAWCIAQISARSLQPTYSMAGELLIPIIADIVEAFPQSSFPGIILGSAVYKLGYINESFTLLEAQTELHQQDTDLWLTLALLYGQSKQIIKSIDTCQRAIEVDATSESLYLHYGTMLSVINSAALPLEEFILVDPDEKIHNTIVWEAVAAYDEVLEQTPESLEAVYRQLLLLIRLDIERFWQQFEQLVTLDTSGEKVREIIDRLYDVDDITPAIHIIEKVGKSDPQRIDLKMNLATAYIEDENGTDARRVLQEISRLEGYSERKMDVQFLLLRVDNPDFEQRMGEISDKINSQTSPNNDDVDFLEVALEQAPDLTSISLLLAKSYLLWEDSDAALEVLLDTQRKFPDDPDILNMLSLTLWQSGEQKLALQYLNIGLEKHPNHVPLVVRAALYLFENNQPDESKSYMARAELLAPRHPEVVRARAYIAKEWKDNEHLRSDPNA